MGSSPGKHLRAGADNIRKLTTSKNSDSSDSDITEYINLRNRKSQATPNPPPIIVLPLQMSRRVSCCSQRYSREPPEKDSGPEIPAGHFNPERCVTSISAVENFRKPLKSAECGRQVRRNVERRCKSSEGRVMCSCERRNRCRCCDDDDMMSDLSANSNQLPYQNYEEYPELLQELEEALSSRNRIRQTMREFEIMSRQNKNLERPIDYPEERFECCYHHCRCVPAKDCRRDDCERRNDFHQQESKVHWKLDPITREWCKDHSRNQFRSCRCQQDEYVCRNSDCCRKRPVSARKCEKCGCARERQVYR